MAEVFPFSTNDVGKKKIDFYLLPVSKVICN